MLILFLFVLGTSYAIWQIMLQQTTENVITTGCFKIEFRDVNPIHLDKAYPISDEEGRILTPYEFTITNTCNSYGSFQINLEILNTTTLENLKFLKVMLDDKTNLLTDSDEVTKTLTNAKTAYKLKKGYLRENGSKTFSLRLWMDEGTPASEEFMNKLFESKITVIATYKENLDNTIKAIPVSQNESFSDSETFQIHVTSDNYDLVSMSDDLETWEELETKGKEITVEKSVTTNGSHTFYFQDEAENIQDVTVTATKIDDKKPIANMSVVKENNVIKIDASGSKDNETSISKYYYSKDGINYEESTENKFQFTNNYVYGVATTMLTNFERNQIQKVYLKVEDEVGNVSDVKELSNTDTDFAYDETVDNNLRYIGADPNNYVSFNNELWRIIGVMNNIDDGTGKKEKRIKLRREENIGNYSWDSSASNINNGNGINEWSQADVKNLLNGYYYNRQSGYCYNGPNSTTVLSDFRNIGIAETSKLYIGPTLWYTGGNGTEVHQNNILTSKFYGIERSNNIGKICTGGFTCNDTVTRTTTWKGNIGLISPSDYGYATSGGTTTSRASCLSTYLINWENYKECFINNWLYKSNLDQWLMNPVAINPAAQSNAYGAFDIASCGSAQYTRTGNAQAIFPTLFLKAHIKIDNGDGSRERPFTLSLN